MHKKFFEEIPFIRAIACIMVVLVHVTSGTITAENGSVNYLNLYLYQLTRLGTPIFAVVSAFLLFSSVKRSGFNIKRFFLSRTTKILLPFILWTFGYLYFKIYSGQDVFTDKERTIKYFVLGTGYYHLYFIITVIQFYIIFPLLQLIRGRKLVLTLFFLSLPLNAYWLMNAEGNTQIELLNSILTHRSFLLNWISFFMFGAVLAHFYSEILEFVKRQKLLFLILAGLVFTALCVEINPDHIFTSSRPINLIYVPVFVLFLLSIHEKISKNPMVIKVLNVIGNYSMGIFLVHPFVKVQISKYLTSDFWNTPLILVTTILIMFISMVIIRLILFLPKSNYLVPVGKAKREDRQSKKAVLNTSPVISAK